MNLKEGMKTKLLLSLEQADLSDEHKEYIKSVVAYIDNALTSRMQGDNISIGTYVNEMLEIAKKIKQGKTGNTSIDEIGEVLPYVDNYIATISDAGGMYKYVLEIYEKEISSGEITTSSSIEEKSTEELGKEGMKTKLLLSLEQADLSDEHKEYIKSVVAYIDNALTSRMQGDNISMGTYVNEMLEIAKKIKQGKTGNTSIDEIGEVLPYVDNYIATISDAGGMYKYVLEIYEKEINDGDIAEKRDSEGSVHIDESKFAEIYGKAKGRIKEAFSKIKSFLNIRSNDRNDKTNDETVK